MVKHSWTQVSGPTSASSDQGHVSPLRPLVAALLFPKPVEDCVYSNFRAMSTAKDAETTE